jgi:hypothetical protein
MGGYMTTLFIKEYTRISEITLSYVRAHLRRWIHTKSEYAYIHYYSREKKEWVYVSVYELNLFGLDELKTLVSLLGGDPEKLATQFQEEIAEKIKL